MNKEEYYNSPICCKNYEYRYTHKLLQQWKKDNGITEKCVIHHRDDTPELNQYNNIDHYERWGFDENGEFIYGKYVIFLTQSEHNTYHFKGKPNTKLAGENNPMYNVHRKGKDAPFYGHEHSVETRNKMSANHANVSCDKNPFYGKSHSEKTMATLNDYHKLTSDAYKKYQANGGTLKWKAFRHAIKIGELDLNNI